VIDLRRLRESHRRFLAQHRAAVSEELHRAAQEGVAEVQRNPGFKPRSGALQRATQGKVIRTRSGGIVRLRNPLRHAGPIDKGSPPHVILPRRAKVLRFTNAAGAVVFTRRVNHPGNRAFHFLSRARDQAGQRFHTRMTRRMVAIARRF